MDWTDDADRKEAVVTRRHTLQDDGCNENPYNAASKRIQSQLISIATPALIQLDHGDGHYLSRIREECGKMTIHTHDCGDEGHL